MSISELIAARFPGDSRTARANRDRAYRAAYGPRMGSADYVADAAMWEYEGREYVGGRLVDNPDLVALAEVLFCESTDTPTDRVAYTAPEMSDPPRRERSQMDRIRMAAEAMQRDELRQPNYRMSDRDTDTSQMDRIRAATEAMRRDGV